MLLFQRIILSAACVLTLYTANAQQKKTVAKAKSTKMALKAPLPQQFSLPASVSDVADLKETDRFYQSVKDLVERYNVLVVYNDNTFRPNEPLRRGDFVISFNSALNALKYIKDSLAVDSSVVNTYDISRGGAYLSSASDVKDVSPTSYYYPATSSLVEKWGVAAPFTLSKTLSPTTVLPASLYASIMKVVLGYNVPASMNKSGNITRGDFAVALDSALNRKASDIYNIHQQVVQKKEEERRAQQAIIDQEEKQRKDSVAQEIELRKAEAQKQEMEARKKLKKNRRSRPADASQPQ
jgi:hypothetical protein